MSKQLIKLHKCSLIETAKQKASNGEQIETLNEVGTYNVTVREINDDISFSMYGADLNTMIRVSSIRNELEQVLKTKQNNSSDNLSKYYIKYEDKLYSIRSVRNKYIDIKLFETNNN